MNAELVTAMESAVKLLAACEDKAVNQTVQYEIVTSKIHAQRAIDWEKFGGSWSVPQPARLEIEKAKP